MGAAEGSHTWNCLAGGQAVWESSSVSLVECMQVSVPHGSSHPTQTHSVSRPSSLVQTPLRSLSLEPHPFPEGGGALWCVEPPASQLGKDLTLPRGLGPPHRHLVKQQHEVDGECQEEGQEPQRVEVPRQVVLEREEERSQCGLIPDHISLLTHNQRTQPRLAAPTLPWSAHWVPRLRRERRKCQALVWLAPSLCGRAIAVMAFYK